MTFTKRPLVAGATLGERLRTLRSEVRLTPEEIGAQISVAAKYIVAIEESRYKDLPGLVYARQFVRRYADYLATDVEMAMSIFEQEYAVVSKTGPAARPLLTARANTEFPWYRRHFRLILSSVVVALVLSYIGIQVVRNFLPPRLDITNPAKDISTKELQYTIRGQTDPSAAVSINDQDVQAINNGTFSVTVDLHVGINALKISATKKHSSARVVIRNILVEQ
jgi:cytoskeletal protein RodZ